MTRTSIHLALLASLWVLVGLIGFLMCVQVLLLAYAPRGTWHWPRIYRVTVREFDADPQAAYPSIIIGKNVRQAPEEPFPSDAKGDKGPGPDTEEAEGAKASPRARVDAKDLEQDDEDTFEDRAIALMKSERQGLSVGDSFWVLDNYYRSPLRPPQFRLTPIRVLVEFPEPLLVLALLAIFRLRRARARAARVLAEAPRERIVLKDDFHARADRFKAPVEPPSGPEVP